MTTIRSIQPLAAGAANYATPAGLLNLPIAPIAARGDVMKQGAGASNISAFADATTFTTQGGSFDFDAAIPADGTTYLLLMEFFLP
jgi:hypothetical protein